MPRIVNFVDPGDAITVNGIDYQKGRPAKNSGIVSYWAGRQGASDHITLEDPKDHIPNRFDFHFHFGNTRYDCVQTGDTDFSVSKHGFGNYVPQSAQRFAEAVRDQVCSFDEVSRENNNTDDYGEFLAYSFDYSDDESDYSDYEDDFFEDDAPVWQGGKQSKKKHSLSQRAGKVKRRLEHA